MGPARRKVDVTTRRRVEEYENLMPLLEAMSREFTEFAKKRPDGVLSAGKVKAVNRLLGAVYEVVKDEPARKYLDLFEEDDLPQNSDVMLMMGQTVAAMRAFRAKYYQYDEMGISGKWATGGG